MSLKDNMDYIKGEVSAQESFLENVFKVEQFYKKYKILIFGAAGAAAAVLIIFTAMGYMEKKNKMEANTLFNSAVQDPDNKKNLAALKEKDEKLYEIAAYLNDPEKEVNIDYLKELSLYTKAVEANDPAAISKTAANQKLLIKDFAVFNEALVLAQNGKYKEAKESLKLIPSTSDVAGLVKMLEHFLVTK